MLVSITLCELMHCWLLDMSTVTLGDLLRGAIMGVETTSEIQVKLVPSTVFRCTQQFGPDDW